MLPPDVLQLARAAGALPAAEPTPADAPTAAGWLLCTSAQRHPAVRRYVFFLKWMYETFHAVAECFPRENPHGQQRKDDQARATSPEEMLHLAQQLYLLASHGVE